MSFLKLSVFYRFSTNAEKKATEEKTRHLGTAVRIKCLSLFCRVKSTLSLSCMQQPEVLLWLAARPGANKSSTIPMRVCINSSTNASSSCSISMLLLVPKVITTWEHRPVVCYRPPICLVVQICMVKELVLISVFTSNYWRSVILNEGR